MGIDDGFPDLGDVLFRGLAQLLAAVALATLGEQVHHAGTATGDPVCRECPVHKSEHLYALQQAVALSPPANFAHRIPLPFRNAGRCDLDAVDLGTLQQEPGDEQLLMRHKIDAAGLLPVPQGRVHYLDLPLLHDISFMHWPFPTPRSWICSPGENRCRRGRS